MYKIFHTCVVITHNRWNGMGLNNIQRYYRSKPESQEKAKNITNVPYQEIQQIPNINPQE